MRQHLEFAAAQGSVGARERLVGPVFPVPCARAWDAFAELDRWRAVGAFGMSPITLHDVEAYERRFADPLSADECAWVKLIDGERLAAAAPRAES